MSLTLCMPFCLSRLILIIFLAPLIVEPGHRAFKFNKFSGIQDSIMREGWHFKIPYFERQIIYDVRTHPKQIKSVTGSKGKFHQQQKFSRLRALVDFDKME